MRIIITQLKSGMQELQMICEKNVNIEVSYMVAVVAPGPISPLIH